MEIEKLQAELKIAVLEQQRNAALAQVVEALVNLNITNEMLRQVTTLSENRFLHIAELTETINTQAAELESLRKKPGARKQ